MSEIGFGAWGIGGGWGPQNDDEAIRALRRAYDLGVTFFDTALGYGDGHSEQLIARALGDVRDQIVIATKIPPKTYRWPVLPHEPVYETFPADWIVECTEQSLRNLNTDYIDVQQLHAWTPPYTDQPEWYEALSRLKESGKVRAFGVSSNDWDPYGPVGAIKAGLLDTVQVIYNIFEQRPAEQLLPAAQEHHVGIIVRVPFEEGLLTGQLTPDYRFAPGDWRAEWLTSERLAAAAPRVEALKQFGAGSTNPGVASAEVLPESPGGLDRHSGNAQRRACRGELCGIGRHSPERRRIGGAQGTRLCAWLGVSVGARVGVRGLGVRS